MRLIHSFLLLLFSFGTVAQIEVTGHVVDVESGEGLIGAHIYLLEDWRNGTISGVDGAFRLDVQSLKDSIIVSYVGFKEELLPLSEYIRIDLQALEIAGETVVIQAKPLVAEEFKYLEISKIDIYTNPSAKADPILAVNALPSSTTTDESANISLRGSSPLETGMFLNNVPVYDAVRYSQLNGIGTFSIFNTSIIKDVVVFPGNPPLEFGNTTSGSISLTTDDQVLDDNTNSAILSLASIGFSREQKLSQSQSLKVFSNWQPSQLIKSLNESSLREIDSFKSGDLGVYWYGASEKVEWKVFNYTVLEGFKFKFKHPTFDGIFDQAKTRSFLVSSLSSQVGNGTLSFNNGLSTSNAEFDYSNVLFNVKKNDLFLGTNYLITKLKYSFKSGISYDKRVSDVTGDVHEISYALGPDHPTISIEDRARSEVAEVFAYFKYFLSEKFTLGSGIEKISDIRRQDYLSRQLNVAFTSASWTITAGTGRYHKTGLIENTGEAFTSSSNQSSLDFKYEKNSLLSSFSLFYKKNRIDGVSYQAHGAELLTEYQFSPTLSGSTSLTWLSAEQDQTENYPYDLSYFIRGNLAYKPSGFWTFETIFVAREGTLFTPISSATFDSDLNAFEPVFSDQQRLDPYLNIGVAISKIFAVSEKMKCDHFCKFDQYYGPPECPVVHLQL